MGQGECQPSARCTDRALNVSMYEIGADLCHLRPFQEGVLPFKVCKVATEGAENPNGMLLIVTVKYYDTQIDIRQRLSRRQPKRDVNDVRICGESVQGAQEI